MKKSVQKKSFGIISGLAIYSIVGSFGLYLLQIFWPAFAIASIDKSYSLEMYLFRLLVGIIASVFSGITATNIAQDRGKSAWIVGLVVFCIGSYIHFFIVWTDYPGWYHFVYLLSVMPILGLSHYLKKERN